MPKNLELVAFLAVLIAIVVLGVVAGVLGSMHQGEAAAAVVGIATGLVGVLKMPSFQAVEAAGPA